MLTCLWDKSWLWTCSTHLPLALCQVLDQPFCPLLNVDSCHPKTIKTRHWPGSGAELYSFWGTLFLEMKPMILSPFFLLRSTQTEGPERSGPSILPAAVHSIWNTQQCPSLSCGIQPELTLLVTAPSYSIECKELNLMSLPVVKLSHPFYSPISKQFYPQPRWASSLLIIRTRKAKFESVNPGRQNGCCRAVACGGQRRQNAFQEWTLDRKKTEVGEQDHKQTKWLKEFVGGKHTNAASQQLPLVCRSRDGRVEITTTSYHSSLYFTWILFLTNIIRMRPMSHSPGQISKLSRLLNIIKLKWKL